MRSPADVIGAAVKVMRIATGQESEEVTVKSAAAELGSRGSKARAKSLSKKKWAEIAKAAAAARWLERGADGRRLDLNGCNLTGVALQGALLNRAGLNRAILSGVLLSNAKLEWAELTGTELEGALLDRADLKGARVRPPLVRQSLPEGPDRSPRIGGRRACRSLPATEVLGPSGAGRRARW